MLPSSELAAVRRLGVTEWVVQAFVRFDRAVRASGILRSTRIRSARPGGTVGILDPNLGRLSGKLYEFATSRSH